MTLPMLEKDIQNLILEFLAYQPRTFVWRQNAGSHFEEDSNGKRHGFRASTPGVSDILGIYRGIPIAIEVKRPGKKPTDLQVAFLQKFAAAGGIAICACSLEGVKKTLDEILAIQPFKGVYVVEIS